MQTDLQHDYSSFIWSFESGKGGKEREKAEEIEYLENEKSLLNEIKTFFIIFEMLSFEKIYKKYISQALNITYFSV